MIRERFAPSPTGFLHLGHAYSALVAFDAATQVGADFLLRIEDIDQPRCKPAFEAAIYEDLTWLGLSWHPDVMRQSNRFAAYADALNRLIGAGVCYPCSCTRKDIQQALSAPQEGAEQQFGPDGVIYPGLCRGRDIGERKATDAVRLNMEKAIEACGINCSFQYEEIGENCGVKTFSADFLIEHCGDVILARKDIGTSYHLAVVVDDAAQQVSHVTRGLDMAPATAIHVVLQRLLGLHTPIYRHHRLIRDDTGKRLAKRHDASALRSLRDQGWTAQDVREAVNL